MMLRVQLKSTSDLVLFFFQAEDGIRDVAVTGVQTCALPILKQLGFQLVFDARSQEFAGRHFVTVAPPDGTANLTLVAPERDSDQHKLIGRYKIGRASCRERV